MIKRQIMDLIIVESPSKAKTIAKYLKGKYKVDASGGHVRDLPEKRLGVKIDGDFEPQYTISPDKKETIKRLSAAAEKADRVFLATDPDREGEAISWHLQHALKIKAGQQNRIVFNEVSKSAIDNALKNPREINMGLVDAQQARRVLDRLVGYKLSPLLIRRIQPGLSAGRVQSVALRLIVEREREILAFKPVEYWNLTAELTESKSQSDIFKAMLAEKDGKKYKPSDEKQALYAESVIKSADLFVKDIKRTVSKSAPPPPFTTSTMQQDASNKLSVSAPEVMRLAQQLYEGVDTKEEGHLALVTYIRTDSVRISPEAQNNAREYLKQLYGQEFVPEKPNFYKSKKGAQDAHEAIRPIDINKTPQSVKALLSPKHYKLYKLIYERFLASQMTPALYDLLQIDIAASEFTLKASGKTLKFKGFTQVYEDFRKDDEDEDGAKGALLPNLTKGDKLLLKNLLKEQKFTKPPSRYTDASLVKAMEDKGIGRPSTYASIISVLSRRNYTVKENRFMVPTEIAFKITDLLLEHFSDIVDVSFTSDMEDKLDEIEEGGDWKDILRKFYPPFSQKLLQAVNAGNEITDIPCEKCGQFMVKKSGRYGKFLACPNEDCKNIKSDAGEVSQEVCPKCGANLLIKEGRFGKYYACPNYPDCQYLRPFDSKPGEAPCEKCGGITVIKKGKYGEYISCVDCKANTPIKKQSELAGTCPLCKKPTKKVYTKSGRLFYGCTGYPECNFTSWEVPSGETCKDCGKHTVIREGAAACSDKNCAAKG